MIEECTDAADTRECTRHWGMHRYWAIDIIPFSVIISPFKMISMMLPSSTWSSGPRGSKTSSLLCLYNSTLSRRSPYGCSGNCNRKGGLIDFKCTLMTLKTLCLTKWLLAHLPEFKHFNYTPVQCGTDPLFYNLVLQCLHCAGTIIIVAAHPFPY